MHHLINRTPLIIDALGKQVGVSGQGAGSSANPFENVEIDPQDDAIVWGEGSFKGLDRAAVSQLVNPLLMRQI